MLSSLVLLLSSAAGSALALNNGLATTPQMGWNTWNYHACEINSSVILDAASAIKQRGLDQLGYKYVSLPILYSACNWGEDGPWNFGSEIFNSWRMSGDVANSFDRASDYCPCESTIGCQLAGFHCNIRKIINMAAPLGQKAGPGRWNDLDMLQIGNGALNRDESITHFSLWSALKSPLILGNDVSTDLTRFSNESLAIVANEHVIAVNQDPLGTPAERILNLDSGTHQVWTGPLTNGSYVVAMVNFAEEPWTRTLTLADIFYDAGKEDQQARSAAWNVYDLWEGMSSRALSSLKSMTDGAAAPLSLKDQNVPSQDQV
ncbi:glycoside hydrolase family 27 protein [Ceraceosorus bombacis]|uniref:Alpha-galactosidase n=1 Tax=Ceraceosorus bombacis TaxID=401625 RepID=A0A0N7LAR0_9BASI|nr:glycoside hydrolase family 27 protein [Ceraceosorus bombacis]